MFKLETNEVTFPPIDRNINYPIRVKYEGDKTEVVSLTSSCGCTTPTFTNDGYIEVIYKSKDHATDVLQKVWIWLDDGKPLTVKSEKGQFITNWAKSKIELVIKGKVK